MSVRPMNAQPRDVELAGELVRLVPVHPRHAARAFELVHGNDDILRWLVWEGPESLAELEERYATWVRPSEQGDDYHLAILDARSGELCGTIGARFAGHPGTGDVGYWLDPGRWGGGLMSEAVRLIDHLAFRHLGARMLSACVFVGNVASRRVLEKAGYRMTHLARGAVEKRGRPVDEWCFTLTPRDHDAAVGAWRPAVERVEG
jgi:RimJ/RimL family protein N-acetyltransferase